MASKPRTRMCARCGRQPRTRNGYCKACDAARKAEEREKNMPKPETEGGVIIRNAIDAAFGLLDTVPGVVLEVPSPYGPIRVIGNGDGTIVPMLTGDQKRVLNTKLEGLEHG